MSKILAFFVLALMLIGCLVDLERDAPTRVSEGEKVEPKILPNVSPEESFLERQVHAAFTPVDCPPAPARKFPNTSYSGPMIDAHVHFRSLPDGGPGSESSGENLGTGYKVAQWICMLDYEGTRQAWVFFPVWEPITQESLDVVKRAMETYPDRFVPFIMPPDDDGSSDGFPTVDAVELERMLSVYPGMFQGYGEIGLYPRQDGAPELPPDSSRLNEIYPVVSRHNLVVYFHPGEDQWESFGRVLDANPGITFVFHGDHWIDCSTCDRTPRRVAEILEKHPNAYYGVDELYGNEFLMRPEVSKEQFITHFADYGPLLEKDLANWKEFIERHPDQVLWDTDRGVGAPWSLDLEVALTLNDYSRAFIGRLDPSVQEKFAYRNAEKIFGNRATTDAAPMK